MPFALQDLVAVVTTHPGSSAKLVAKHLRARTGDDSIRKTDVNPTLYAQKKLFRSEGSSPPVWFPVAKAPATPKVAAVPAKPFAKPALRLVVSKAKSRAAPRKVATLGSIPKLAGARQPLWQWQKDAVKAWEAAQNRGVIEAVTGTGKTNVGLKVIRDHLKTKKTPCLILVPSVVLLEQWKTVIQSEFGYTVLSTLGGPSGYAFDPKAAITVGVVNSVARRIVDMDGRFGLVVADECHRYGAKSYRHALFESAGSRLGLTAIFERASDDAVKEVLEPYFDGICFRYGYAEAKRDKVIAPYAVRLASVELSVSERRVYDRATRKIGEMRKLLIGRFGYDANNFQKFIGQVGQAAATYGSQQAKIAGAYLKATSERKGILTECKAKMNCMERVAPYIRAANGTLVFCETKKGAAGLAAELRRLGVTAADYHSGLSSVSRTNTLDDLVNGKLEAVVAVRALDEGIDVPKLDLGVIISSSKQRRQMIQRMGRILRKKSDGSIARFIVVYAKDTAEDPFFFPEGRAQNHLEILLKHAERVKREDW